MHLIDTHCHLTYAGLVEDVGGVLERAAAAGVEQVIVPGTSLQSSQSAVALAEAHSSVFAAVGVHPTDGNWEEEEAAFKVCQQLATHKKVVAIGEVGLDYYHLPSESHERAVEKERQAERFRRYLHLARDVGKPLIIHSRDCFADLYSILRHEGHGVPFVIHCFTGSEEEAIAWLKMGGFVSFTGILTYSKNEVLRSVAATLPLERVMVETDAPYLAPEGFRGQVCEPRFTRSVAECLAAAKGLSLEEVAAATTKTATHFFKLD